MKKSKSEIKADQDFKENRYYRGRPSKSREAIAYDVFLHCSKQLRLIKTLLGEVEYKRQMPLTQEELYDIRFTRYNTCKLPAALKLADKLETWAKKSGCKNNRKIYEHVETQIEKLFEFIKKLRIKETKNGDTHYELMFGGQLIGGGMHFGGFKKFRFASEKDVDKFLVAFLKGKKSKASEFLARIPFESGGSESSNITIVSKKDDKRISKMVTELVQPKFSRLPVFWMTVEDLNKKEEKFVFEITREIRNSIFTFENVKETVGKVKNKNVTSKNRDKICKMILERLEAGWW